MSNNYTVSIMESDRKADLVNQIAQELDGILENCTNKREILEKWYLENVSKMHKWKPILRN